jgi:hypothetical protein
MLLDLTSFEKAVASLEASIDATAASQRLKGRLKRKPCATV